MNAWVKFQRSFNYWAVALNYEGIRKPLDCVPQSTARRTLTIMRYLLRCSLRSASHK